MSPRPQRRAARALALVALAGPALAAIGAGATAAGATPTTVPIFRSPALTTLASHVATDGTGIPADTTVCFAYGGPSDALSRPITRWDVGGYTFLHVADRATQQAGKSNAKPGTTACQVSGTRMGMLVNTLMEKSAKRTSGVQLAYQWSRLATMTRPWAHGPTSSLHLQTYWSIAKRRASGAVQYGQVFVNLHDNATGNNVWVVLHPWDSRGNTYMAQSESVHVDYTTAQFTQYDVDSYFLPGQRFSTLDTGSQRSAHPPAAGTYSAHVTYQNISAALAAVNALRRVAVSSNPADYSVSFVGSGTEQAAVASDATGVIGSVVGDVVVEASY